MADGVGGALRVVHGDDIAAAIVDQIRDRDGALLVMTTSATGLVSQRRGSVSAHVLSETRQPVLLIGPAVPDPCLCRRRPRWLLASTVPKTVGLRCG